RETLHEAETRLRQRDDALRQREETSRKRLTDALDTQVRQARKEIDEVVAQLKARAAAIASAPRLVSTGDARRGALAMAAALAFSCATTSSISLRAWRTWVSSASVSRLREVSSRWRSASSRCRRRVSASCSVSR